MANATNLSLDYVAITQNLILQKNKLDKISVILNEFSYLNDNRHELGKQ